MPGSSNRIPGLIIVLFAVIMLLATPVYSQDRREYSIYDVTLFGGAQFFDVFRDHPAHSFADGPLFGVRFTQDFSKYVGVEESFGYGINNLRLKPFPPSPIGEVGAGVRNYQLAAGPVFHFTPRGSKIRPFVMLGAGATWYSPTGDANNQFRNPAFSSQYGVRDIDMRYGPAGIWGAGLKINASRRIGFRLDVRGMLTQTPHFGLPTDPSGPGTLYIPRHGSEHALQATAGVTFRFGLRSEGPPPPPPVPPPPPPPPKPEIQLGALTGIMDVCAGDTLTVAAPATVSTGAPLTYEWRLNDQATGGNSPKITIPTQGLSGPQTVAVRVSTEGASQSATGTFNLKPYTPPTATLTGLPATIKYGETLPVSATAAPTSSDCGGNVALTYTVSEGSISNGVFDSNGVKFDLSNRSRRQTRTVKVVATATDQKGGTGRAEGDITVVLDPEARRLDDLVFPAGNSRVNNCAKRLLLEELTPLLREEPTSRVILVGHRDERETGRAAATLDRSRAMNAAAVVSAGTGICPQLETSRISIVTAGTNQDSTPRPSLCADSVQERRGQAVRKADPRAGFRRVEVWFVPEGAALPAALQNATPVPADQLKALGCPK
jgi:outer membrane protein OmpA-like peptidoglycan-associated protein